MKVVITGAAGFVASRIADYLLSPESPIKITELLLADLIQPPSRDDPRVSCISLELTSLDAPQRLLASKPDILFHLAAAVSGHAEADFDTGLAINFDATRSILEEARKKCPNLRFVFSSTCGVYGGKLPAVVDDLTVITPQTSYGAAKAMSELLINEYSRRGFVDGRVVRLPTVSVRSGAANRAVTSFASGLVREPLAGLEAIIPVPETQEIWITSPSIVVKNIVHAALIPGRYVNGINLPGLRIAVRDMVAAVKKISGPEVASKIRYEQDELITRMVASFPDNFDNTRAISLGFFVDSNFEDIVLAYIREMN